MKADDHFHTGVVVDDFDGTLERLTALFGHGWCSEINLPTRIRLENGDVLDVEMRYTYSTRNPRLEIVQSVPGTPWVPVPSSGIHHLGYWSDVPADVAALEANGYVAELAGLDDEGRTFWGIWRPPAGGPRIELIGRESRPSIEQWWAASAKK